MRKLTWSISCLWCANVALLTVSAQADEPSSAKLRLAFTSLKERPLYTVVHFYEHDGHDSGKIVGKISTLNNRSDHHPALSRDGKLCVFAGEVVGKPCTIEFWDFAAEKTYETSVLNKTPQAQMAPSVSANGRLVAFEAWNRPGSAGRWDVLLYDRTEQTFVETPNLNTSRHDERKPSLSPDGRWIAFTTNGPDGSGRTDIRLYDRQTGRIDQLPQLNSESSDTEPTLSADAKLIAFVSNRPANKETVAGTRDIYLYDRAEKRLLSLPGLNSLGQEQSPSLTGDGMYLAFVSERLDGAGERDIFIYDRQSEKLISTPDLNSPEDEYDPCLVILTAE